MAQNQRSQPTAEDKKNTRIGCGIMLAALLVVGGCSALINDDNDSSSASSSTSSSAYDDKATTLEVGDFVGMDLQTAQDSAQAGGIYHLDSTDASGLGRQQLLDRNWTVCAQAPAAGTTMSADATLTFDTVKSSEGETCDDPTGLGTSEEPVTDDSSTTSGTEDPGIWDSFDEASSSTGTDTGDASSDDSSSSSSSSSTGGTSSPESDSESSVTPDDSPQAPAGATAQCHDGTYSYSAHRRGTCSHHGGVAVWLASVPS
ncbi:DUF3761 domain-containing protein [Streptomyces sp. bgisy082]|uniref:DUF3761 domain-containing protein n=1 Tax=Streptomyces sp. bgisy082 TaxID=3413776 RepID=UPI003D73B307